MKKDTGFHFYLTSSHCVIPKWYCKFLFWLKHGGIPMRREFVGKDEAFEILGIKLELTAKP